ncbi:hypothetical protein D3C79_773140 [compost metagenome]
MRVQFRAQQWLFAHGHQHAQHPECQVAGQEFLLEIGRTGQALQQVKEVSRRLLAIELAPDIGHAISFSGGHQVDPAQHRRHLVFEHLIPAILVKQQRVARQPDPPRVPQVRAIEPVGQGADRIVAHVQRMKVRRFHDPGRHLCQLRPPQHQGIEPGQACH